jgi:hypothetical protein
MRYVTGQTRETHERDLLIIRAGPAGLHAAPHAGLRGSLEDRASSITPSHRRDRLRAHEHNAATVVDPSARLLPLIGSALTMRTAAPVIHAQRADRPWAS